MTRIELLVVISAIVILFSIIAPSLSKAKESAMAIICKTNLRTYSIAIKHYLDDNENRYPESMHTLVNGDNTGGGLPAVPLACQWHDERISPEVNPGFAGYLWPYLETMKSSVCPTFKRFALRYGQYHPNHDSRLPIIPQYAYSQNVFLGRGDGKGGYLAVGKESEVVNPSNVFVFAEETIWQIPDLTAYTLNDTCFFPRHPYGGFRTGDFPGCLGDSIATYHNTSIDAKDDGVGNVLFVDGHVRLVDPYDSVKTDWGEISGSFRYAWPLEGTFNKQSPY